MNEWKTLKLPDCLDGSPGSAKIPRKKFLVNGKFPIVSQEEGLINGYWDDESDLIKLECPIVIFGDHTQVLKFVDFDFVLGADGVKLLKPKTFLDAKYLYYFLLGHPLAELGYARHYRLLKEFDVRFPSLPEQKRIAAILDETFAGIETAIANTEKNLANARGLFESYLNAVFTQQGDGWARRKLADVCENLDSKRIPITKSKRKAGDVPYYGASGVVDYVADYIFDEDLLLVSEDGANLLARTYPIAFSVSGKSWVNNHAHVLKFEEVASQRFIEFYLNSISLEPYVSGMAQPKLNQKALNNITVPFPPVEIQKEVVEKLDDLNKSKDRLAKIYIQKRSSLDELKQSLLQKAFSGELTSNHVVAFGRPPSIQVREETATAEFTAHLLAFAYDWHAVKKRDKTYGRVKAQKILHLVESVAEVNLGREPVKDAAGPNDFQHMLRAEEWARENRFFEFVSRNDGKGYDFRKGSNYEKLINCSVQTVEPYRARIERVLTIVSPMNTEEAEILATVHAAWNNLLLDGVEISNEAIIREARENWHESKNRLSATRFREAIQQIRRHGIVPDGTAKAVTGQGKLL